MKICIICKAEQNDLIKGLAISKFGEQAEYRFLNKPEAIELTGTVFVIEHAVVVNVKSYDFRQADGVYVCFGEQLISVNEEDQLVQIRQNAVHEKNWNKAKRINDVLIDINFLKKNTVSSAYPDYLQIETTSFCNAKCIMCSHYFSNNKGAQMLQNDTVHNMEDALQLSHTVSLNGMGEPFASPYVSDQIDYYSSFGNRIVTNTNLSILNDRLVAQINTSFDWLEISIDGATKDIYENIRKNLKLDSIKANLKRLKEECPHVRKHIATVIMRQNVKEMPMMVELAHEAGANIITFMTLNANIIIQNSQDEMCNYPNVLQYYSAKALQMGEKLGIPVIVPNAQIMNREISFEEIQDELARMESLPLFKDEKETAQMMHTAKLVEEYLKENDEIQRDTVASTVKCHGICDWILKQSYIDLQGNVAMCCRNQSFHVGNVNEEKEFGAVWNSRFYQKLREIFYSGYVPEACLKCGLIESGNLKHLSIEMTDDFYRDPIYKVSQKKTLQGLLKG